MWRMKFLRVLTNSLLSGLFFALLLTLLVADLNINTKIDLRMLAQIVLFLMMTYGFLLTCLCVLLFFFFQFLSGKKGHVAFISPPFLSLSFSVIILFFLIIFRENCSYFVSFFDSAIKSLLRTQGITLLFLAALGFVVFFGYLSSKKNARFFWVYFILLAAGLYFVTLQRWKYPFPQPALKIANIGAKKIEKRVTVIGMEGLSFDFLIPLTSEGKLPNFSWLMEQGSWGKLESFTPSEPYILSQSFNTGKYPSKHRQISLHQYQILNMKDRLEVVPRFILFRQLTRAGLLKMYPHAPEKFSKDIWQIFEENKLALLKMDWPAGQSMETANAKSEKLFNTFYREIPSEPSSLFRIVRQAFYKDSDYEERASLEKNQAMPQLFYLFLDGLNTVEIFFYKYSFPALFGNILQENLIIYGTVIEKYYQFYDQIIGKYLTSLKEDELLIVYSPHGTEPLPLWKRFVEWMLGNPQVSAYHEFAPAGVIFFYGKGIARGNNVEGVEIVDVAPTLLYYLGLPVGKDMDGIVKSPLFMRDFIAENPIFYISSYEEIEVKNSPHP